ncbi:MAG: hypothetical protein ACRENE_31130, partial [Polyangiaceae bacterium]
CRARVPRPEAERNRLARYDKPSARSYHPLRHVDPMLDVVARSIHSRSPWSRRWPPRAAGRGEIDVSHLPESFGRSGLE